MIVSGEKKEEYRDIKPFYISRFKRFFGYPDIDTKKVCRVRMRNGYNRTDPILIADCTLSVGTGKPEWGAEPGKEYFILNVKKVAEVKKT